MEKIDLILKDLEVKNDIRILYAVEAGSRAWGLESDDSDFDIRFVYMHNNTKKYLSLSPFKETIDGFSEDRLYDWQGWDITKSLRHINQMNPSITEWLYSPIVYQKDIVRIDFQKEAKQLLIDKKRISTLLYHYRSMAKTNYKKHIENETKVKIKKYLYVIRPVGMVEWLLKFSNKNSNVNQNLIEIDFNKVLEALKPHLSNELYDCIVNVINIKKNSKELDLKPRITCIDDWIENVLNNTNDVLKSIEKTESESDNFNKLTDEYDNLLHSILNVKF